jgi:hypothetical protein
MVGTFDNPHIQLNAYLGAHAISALKGTLDGSRTRSESPARGLQEIRRAQDKPRRKQHYCPQRPDFGMRKHLRSPASTNAYNLSPARQPTSGGEQILHVSSGDDRSPAVVRSLTTFER